MTNPPDWVHIGAVCAKAKGHLVFRGEHDYGACGGHHSADIYIVPNTDALFHPDYEALAEEEGEVRNRLEALEWSAEK